MNQWEVRAKTPRQHLARALHYICLGITSHWFSLCRTGLFLGVADIGHVTVEHRFTNLLFLLFSSFFCRFVLYCFTSTVSSTPSRSLNRDKTQTGQTNKFIFFCVWSDRSKVYLQSCDNVFFCLPIHVGAITYVICNLPCPFCLACVHLDKFWNVDFHWCISYGHHLTRDLLVTLLFPAPGGPPLNVEIVSTTSESFTLTWDPPLEPNGIILGYDVMFYECDESNKKNIHDNIKERKHTIKNLHPYRCYRMYVACESSGGLGAFSDGIERWTKPGGERGVTVLSSLCGLRKHTFRPSFQGLSVRPRYLGRRRLLFCSRA